MTAWSTSLLVALGAGLGGLGRYWSAKALDDRLLVPLGQFPIGTFAVNIVGSFVLALVGAAWAERHPWLVPLVMIGAMGGFTTFSSFSAQTLTLLREQRPFLALCYALGSVTCCVLAATAGFHFGRLLNQSP